MAVTTSINADGELLVGVELADDWPAQPSIVAWLVPSQATYQHVSLGPHPGTCDPYGTGDGIAIGGRKAIFNHHEHERPPAAFRERIYYRVDRSLFTIT